LLNQKSRLSKERGGKRASKLREKEKAQNTYRLQGTNGEFSPWETKIEETPLQFAKRRGKRGRLDRKWGRPNTREKTLNNKPRGGRKALQSNSQDKRVTRASEASIKVVQGGKGTNHEQKRPSKKKNDLMSEETSNKRANRYVKGNKCANGSS